METAVRSRKKKWYERYLPFIAQPPELQLSWLVAACQKRKLSIDELTPYLRLLLSAENVEIDEDLQTVLMKIDGDTSVRFLEIVDIYDLPRLIKSLPVLHIDHAYIALRKVMPSHEKNIRKLVDNVFYAINNRSEVIFKDIATPPIKGEMAVHFQENIERFQKILDDEAFLRSMYPHAT